MPAGRRADAEAFEVIDRLYQAAWALSGSAAQAERLVEQAYARAGTPPRDDLAALVGELMRVFSHSRGGVDAPGEADDSEAGRLYAAIAALPGGACDAVVAVDVAGLPPNAAASALGLDEDVLGARLFRGRRELARAGWV